MLVTHQLQYIKDVDSITLLNNGYIEAQGSYKELKTSKYFSLLIKDENSNESSDNESHKTSNSFGHFKKQVIITDWEEILDTKEGIIIKISFL